MRHNPQPRLPLGNQDRKKGNRLTAGVVNLNNQCRFQSPEMTSCPWVAP